MTARIGIFVRIITSCKKFVDNALFLPYNKHGSSYN